MVQTKRYTERPTDINTIVHTGTDDLQRSPARFLYRKHRRGSHAPGGRMRGRRAGVPRERGPWKLLGFFEKSKLQMLVIHFDSKCLLKRFRGGGGMGN